jgi:hypothetical protein
VKNPPHIVIGVCGPSGSGKSTVARGLWERAYFRHIDRPVYIAKMAAPIRFMLEVVGVEKGDGPGEVPHPAFRDAAQRIGAFFRNEVSEDFWLNIQRRYVASLSRPALVVYDDIRYANETTICDLIVRLNTQRDTGLTGDQMAHESEVGWDKLPFDLAFANDNPADVEGIVDEIEARVKGIIEKEAA